VFDDLVFEVVQPSTIDSEDVLRKEEKIGLSIAAEFGILSIVDGSMLEDALRDGQGTVPVNQLGGPDVPVPGHLL